MTSTNEEVDFEWPPFIRLYKNGRVERFPVSTILPPSPSDPTTGVASKDVVIDPATPVSARFYLPPTSSPPPSMIPLLVYFHGSAFCVESAFSTTYHPYLNNLAARANVLIVSVEYRLAPEHPLPAAYEDCWTALRWAAAGSDPWIAEHADLNRLFLADSMEDLLFKGYIGDCHVNAFVKTLELRREKDDKSCHLFHYVSANLWIRVLKEVKQTRTDVNFKDWDLLLAKYIPHQMISVDCGVYVIKYMEHIVKPGVLDWKACNDWAEKMPLFRAEIMFVILKIFYINDDI